MRPQYEISQVITQFKERFIELYNPNVEQIKVLNSLEQCRTAAMGGHVLACPDCGYIKVSYNSCKNRHCPRCQGFERERWIKARKEELLPIKYFHVVFTLPDGLDQIFLSNQRILISILFNAAWKTINKFATNCEVQTGMIALLHTWGSNLNYHPHLHCIVPAGGITNDWKWKSFVNANNKSQFLFTVKGMSKVFRAKFMSKLSKETTINLDPKIRKKLFEKDWVVYSKAPFCGIGKIVEYIGRYSHRVAITDCRITDINTQTVSFQYKDYKDGQKLKIMTVKGEEFLRRFCLHILPKGVVRIRHYGFLAANNRNKLQHLQTLFQCPVCPNKREKKTWEEYYFEQKGVSPYLCPCCQQAIMIEIEQINKINNKRPPPALIISYDKDFFLKTQNVTIHKHQAS